MSRILGIIRVELLRQDRVRRLSVADALVGCRGRYADEFAFRWSPREMGDESRAKEIIKVTAGKRLTYRQTDETQNQYAEGAPICPLA